MPITEVKPARHRDRGNGMAVGIPQSPAFWTALELKLPAPLLGFTAFVAAWIIGGLLPAATLPAWWQHIAGPLALAGAFISAAGFVSFWRARTTINPLRPDRASRLVTTGVYRFSRNPMYLGLTITLVGWALYLLSLPALLAPVAFVLCIHRFQVLPEERILAERFGIDYEHYRDRVPRWIG